ncbi:MAG: glycosyltransferase family 2 protein [Actinobacteria bacterium]|nr:glycosyltransferase family 2 protein [Actinomycetota bacterium]
MPAFNAERTLARTVEEIPAGSYSSLVLVDDCSTDRTVSVATSLGIDVITHAENRGYGANQKTCYRAALARHADIVVMLHPDNQYDARCIPVMTRIVELGICDVVLGNRIRSRRQVLIGGMPKWKYFANRTSTFVENFILGTALGDFHSGFRAYSREVLETVPFESNSDDFVFDQEFIMQARSMGFEIGDVPVPVRYFKEASSINFRRSSRYGIEAAKSLGSLGLHRAGFRRDPRFIPRSPS